MTLPLNGANDAHARYEGIASIPTSKNNRFIISPLNKCYELTKHKCNYCANSIFQVLNQSFF